MYSLYADSCHDVCIEFLKWLLTRSYQPTRILPGRVPLNWLHICSKSKCLIFFRPSAYYLNVYPRAHIAFYHIKLVINPFQCSLLTSKIGEQLCSVERAGSLWRCIRTHTYVHPSYKQKVHTAKHTKYSHAAPCILFGCNSLSSVCPQVQYIYVRSTTYTSTHLSTEFHNTVRI